MKKLLFVMTVLTLVASFSLPASAKSSVYDFTLRDTSGNPFCDGLYLVLYTPGAPEPKALVDGYHWNDNCASAFTNVNGFKGAVSTYYQYSGTGAVLIVSDPVLGNGAGGGTGVVWLVNTVAGHWTAWESGGGAGEVLVTYGTFVNGTKADVKGTKSALQR